MKEKYHLRIIVHSFFPSGNGNEMFSHFKCRKSDLAHLLLLL
jgi:hypothetical protein